MFPYLVLTIFFVRGITLKGASAGLAHMYTPKVYRICFQGRWGLRVGDGVEKEIETPAPPSFDLISINKFRFDVKVEKLLEPTVWLDAATQVFYSFGLAFGSLIAFGSYNTPDNNCVRDVILVSVCNAFTAIYASVVIFAILGFKAMSNVDKCLER